MKIFAYSYRTFDEKEFFDKFSQEFNVEIGICSQPPTLENVHLAKGYDYVSVITTKIDRPVVEAFSKMGIRMISTRTIGFDHIDLEAAKECGIRVSNASYSPSSVADYTVMLMLMTNRKMKRICQRAEVQDYTLPGIQGVEMHNQTVGIIGTGRIGRTVLKNLTGFGCKLLAYDLYENEEVKEYASYVSLDELFAQSDIISLHMPATESNFHMINKASIEMMKDGARIINTARGSLIDSQALIEAIEQGKLGGAGLDVVEKEFGMYYYDHKSDVLDNRELAILKSFPNVVVTPHMAFYTDQAISDMVYSTVAACVWDDCGEENPYLVLK